MHDQAGWVLVASCGFVVVRKKKEEKKKFAAFESSLAFSFFGRWE